MTLVIFDMDGTMLDTERISNICWESAAQQMGFAQASEVYESMFRQMVGTNMANCKAVIQRHLGKDFDIEAGYALHLNLMDDYYKTHGIPMKPGLIPLLDKLEQLNIKKCVATSTQRERATHKLESINIAHRFEVIVGGNDVKNSKPSPDIFLKAAELCNTPPAECLVLEDSAAGTEGGYRAGMKVINIPDILQPSEETRKMAFAVCKDLFEVMTIFS